MSRVLDDINEKFAGKIRTEKINLTEHREIAKQYNVRYVPHLLFVGADGAVFKQAVGALSLEEIVKIFKEGGVDI